MIHNLTLALTVAIAVTTLGATAVEAAANQGVTMQLNKTY